VNTARRKIHPSLCVALGRGAYVEDLDGNRYHAAYGTVLLSHSFAAVNERFKAVIDHQVLFGVGTSEVQVAVAEKIVEQLA
jgi:glutamate-1-semialdehyde 2,1-aminomutase